MNVWQPVFKVSSLFAFQVSCCSPLANGGGISSVQIGQWVVDWSI